MVMFGLGEIANEITTNCRNPDCEYCWKRHSTKEDCVSCKLESPYYVNVQKFTQFIHSGGICKSDFLETNAVQEVSFHTFGGDQLHINVSMNNGTIYIYIYIYR